MKLGLFTCGYQRYGLERAFADARRFGYDYIELWGGYPHAAVEDLTARGGPGRGAADRAAERIAGIRALAQRYGVPVLCYTPEHNGYPYNYMDGDEDQWERCMEYLEDAIDITAALGAPYMLFSAGHAGYERTQARIDERLKKSLIRLTGHAESAGVTLILEPLTIYESNVVRNLGDLERALSCVVSPHLMGMVDLAVPFTNGEPAAAYVTRLGGRFGYLHLIDNDGVSDSHILPGDGCLPLREVLAQIREAGYDGLMTIELVTGYLKEPSAYAKIAVDRVREMLKEQQGGAR